MNHNACTYVKLFGNVYFYLVGLQSHNEFEGVLAGYKNERKLIGYS